MSRTAKGPKRNIWTDPSPYGTYEGERGDPDQWRKAFGYAWGRQEAVEVLGDDSPWGILGIAPGSNEATIKKAFHKLMLIHHPDKGGDHETCQKIISAYVMLTE